MLYLRRFIQLSSLALVAEMVAHVMLIGLSGAQQEQNTALMAQSVQQKLELVDLQKQQQTFHRLEEQLHFIAALQTNNIRIAKAMRVIIQSVPAAISVTALSQKNNLITLSGIAPTDMDLENFMQIMAKNKVFQQPVLTKLQLQLMGREFQLQVTPHE